MHNLIGKCAPPPPPPRPSPLPECWWMAIRKTSCKFAVNVTVLVVMHFFFPMSFQGFQFCCNQYLTVLAVMLVKFTIHRPILVKKKFFTAEWKCHLTKNVGDLGFVKITTLQYLKFTLSLHRDFRNNNFLKFDCSCNLPNLLAWLQA